jgi:F-type H+-transporting ATPase subunit delta
VISFATVKIIFIKMTVNSNVKVVKRYAAALFAVASKTKQQESVLKELTSLKEVFNKFIKQISFINDPIHKYEVRLDFIRKISKSCNLKSAVINFLEVLAAKRRLPILEDIYERYYELHQTSQGIKMVEVISVKPLTKSEVLSLEKFFIENFKHNIWVDNKVDQDIIGGSIIRIGEVVIDDSVSNKINRLRLNLEESLAE